MKRYEVNVDLSTETSPHVVAMGDLSMQSSLVVTAFLPYLERE